MAEKRRIVQYPREKEDTSTHYPIVSNGFQYQIEIGGGRSFGIDIYFPINKESGWLR